MVTKAEKLQEIEAIYADIRVVLLGKLMERVNIIYHEGDMKEMARVQKRLVSLVESI